MTLKECAIGTGERNSVADATFNIGCAPNGNFPSHPSFLNGSNHILRSSLKVRIIPRAVSEN